MKRRKCMAAVLLSAILILALAAGTGCGAAAAKPGAEGKWLFSSLESGGETMTAAQLGSMEIIIFEFSKDGTAVLNADGKNSGGKWTEKDGTITITDSESGKTDTATLTDADTMVMKSGEDTITMVREGSETAKKVAATITPAASAAESVTPDLSADTVGGSAGISEASVPADSFVSADAAETESMPADSSADSKTSSSLSAVTVDNAEIFQQNGVTVTVTGFSEADDYGPSLNLQIVNGSEKDVAVQALDASVNGYMLNGQLWEEVTAGKKANAQLYLPSAFLENAGIETITEAEFKLSLVNPKDYSTIVTSDPITVKTSAFGTFTQPDPSEGTEIYNANGVRIVSLGYRTDAFENKTIILYAENKTDLPIEISADKTSVDGTMVSASLYIDLQPGKKAVAGFTFFDTLQDPKELDCIFDIENMTSYELIDESEHVQISMT